MKFPKPVITLAICTLAQISALTAGHAAWSNGASLGFAITLAVILAAAVALLCRARIGILLLNLIFPIAVVASFNAGDLSAYTGAIFVVAASLLLLFAPALYSGVPYYPTHRRVYEAVRDLLPSDRSFKFVDLGCGDGRLLAYLAKERPLGEFYGYELSPIAWGFAKLRCLPFGARVHVELRDLWKVDVAKADYIYVFLAPPVMARMWMKLSVEATSAQLIVSNAFEFPVAPSRIVEFVGDGRSRLFIHEHRERSAIEKSAG